MYSVVIWMLTAVNESVKRHRKMESVDLANDLIMIQLRQCTFDFTSVTQTVNSVFQHSDLTGTGKSNTLEEKKTVNIFKHPCYLLGNVFII